MPFRRSRRVNVGTFVDPPVSDLAPIDRVVDDGVLIYLAAARSTVKNGIIVAALGRHADYAAEAIESNARQELERLAQENEATALRLEQKPPEAPWPGDVSDEVVLRKQLDQSRRPEVLRRVAALLRETGESPTMLQNLVDGARAAAMEEILGAIADARAQTTVVADAEYERGKDQRIADFIEFDLLRDIASNSA